MSNSLYVVAQKTCLDDTEMITNRRDSLTWGQKNSTVTILPYIGTSSIGYKRENMLGFSCMAKQPEQYRASKTLFWTLEAITWVEIINIQWNRRGIIVSSK